MRSGRTWECTPIAELLTWDEYAQGWAALHGGYDPRRGAPLARVWLRAWYGVARVAGRLRVPPLAVTVLGLLLSVGVPLVAGVNPFAAAGLVLLAAGADTVDGAVALLTGRTSRLGAVYDSVADRLAEACWAVAIWRLGVPGWLVVAVGGLCWLHEYVRARAAAAGIADVGALTVGERPTRVIMVVTGLVLSGAGGLVVPELRSGTGTAVAALWGVLSLLGVGQLITAMAEGVLGPAARAAAGRPDGPARAARPRPDTVTRPDPALQGQTGSVRPRIANGRSSPGK